ncbi:hypothetical protein C8D92_102348 [Tamilnaduibacter salinus]|uniref:Polysaccharide lyase-like protein n=1 Tax=Tamilnaduibacter salinus TaxID=1484056 RepID=A0A2U1CZV6_9GAMM|nr:hypothetical protein [Tamilnaduibacter salinus]PVY78307.1 hypothetical protein C8D92_102348 [Tamilnaduibacter salinus]
MFDSKNVLKQLALSAVGTLVFSAASAEVLFEESFDDQPDWHSGLEINDLKYLNPFNVRGENPDGADNEQFRERGHTLPEGWDAARQGPVWAESIGDPGFPENVEILAANADKARGGTGKSLVVYRQSTGVDGHNWPSDGQLDAKLATPTDELFVRFWIRFSDNWTPVDTVATGLTKLFRASSVDKGGSPFSGFTNGDSAPIFLWVYQHSANLGLRNVLAFRAHPQETNYSMDNPPMANRSRSNNSYNFVGNIRDLDGDGVDDNTVTLTSLTTGNPVGADGGPVLHDEIWGGGTWRKMEFYLKMNSAPGALDGVAKQWMDGQLIFSNTTVPWQGHESSGGRKWTHVGFGGNSNFHEYLKSVQRTEWRAYDDIVIRNSLPERLQSGSSAKPNPPVDPSVQ